MCFALRTTHPKPSVFLPFCPLSDFEKWPSPMPKSTGTPDDSPTALVLKSSWVSSSFVSFSGHVKFGFIQISSFDF